VFRRGKVWVFGVFVVGFESLVAVIQWVLKMVVVSSKELFFIKEWTYNLTFFHWAIPKHFLYFARHSLVEELRTYKERKIGSKRNLQVHTLF
jgi:hypothetical protein